MRDKAFICLEVNLILLPATITQFPRTSQRVRVEWRRGICVPERESTSLREQVSMQRSKDKDKGLVSRGRTSCFIWILMPIGAWGLLLALSWGSHSGLPAHTAVCAQPLERFCCPWIFYCITLWKKRLVLMRCFPVLNFPSCSKNISLLHKI